MTRDEYRRDAIQLARRGDQIPHVKLSPADVREIRKAAGLREKLRKEITDTYSNSALARRFGISARGIERVLNFTSGRHVI